MAVKNQRTFESKFGTFTVGNHRIVSCETKRCDVAYGWNETVFKAALEDGEVALPHAFFYVGVAYTDEEYMKETLGRGVARWAQAELPGLHIGTGDVINLYRGCLTEFHGMMYPSLSQELFLNMVKGNALDRFVPELVTPRWGDVPVRAGRRDFWIARDLFEEFAGESEDPSAMWHRILKSVIKSRLYNWEEL
nr:MAG TPA: hypothetical protein [Caudoviricetes sp.]